MDIAQKLSDAIKNQEEITYDCRGRHRQGIRTGNPHILYVTVGGHFMVEIWQTEGEPTGHHRKVPGWGAYHVHDIEFVQSTGRTFTAHEKYLPDGKKFRKATIICQLDINAGVLA